MRRSLRLLFATLLALLVSGCQSAFFGVVNRNSSQPDATAVYDPARQLSLDVYRPQAPAADAPVVVFFYGGAWQHGTRGQYRFVGSQLAKHGVVAVVADYRTWPAAGFPAFMGDAAGAVRWTRDHVATHGGDPQRIFLAGHSAGAQIAALLATDPRYLREIGMAPTDLAGVVGLSGPYDFVISGELEAIFGPRQQWPDAMALRFVDGDEPPFLLIHGDADRTVGVRNSVDLDAALRRNGIASNLLRLPDGNHFITAAAFYDPARAPAVLPAVLGFVGADPAATEPEPQTK
ncbi:MULTISPECIES: alpha/beta hydrolase [Luteimonas]|uniref:alpha/beta hydrolase n=1 Tax=Luteimonas TaxID=83614 RepID=UPI0013043C90|nr:MULTISPECIES: alpha/beta hydrolase [Luteimonas]